MRSPSARWAGSHGLIRNFNLWISIDRILQRTVIFLSKTCSSFGSHSRVFCNGVLILILLPPQNLLFDISRKFLSIAKLIWFRLRDFINICQSTDKLCARAIAPLRRTLTRNAYRKWGIHGSLRSSVNMLQNLYVSHHMRGLYALVLANVLEHVIRILRLSFSLSLILLFPLEPCCLFSLDFKIQIFLLHFCLICSQLICIQVSTVKSAEIKLEAPGLEPSGIALHWFGHRGSWLWAWIFLYDNLWRYVVAVESMHVLDRSLIISPWATSSLRGFCNRCCLRNLICCATSNRYGNRSSVSSCWR